MFVGNIDLLLLFEVRNINKVIWKFKKAVGAGWADVAN